MDEISGRRKIILDFIIEHQGCSVAQIERALEGKMARTVIFRHVGQLKNEGFILNLSNKKNENILVPNEENKITFTEKCIRDFKKNYSILLKKSLKHDQIINISRELDFETDEMDIKIKCGKILGLLYSEFKKANSIYDQIRSTCSETDKNFLDSISPTKYIEQADSNLFLKTTVKSNTTPLETLQERLESLKNEGKRKKMKREKTSYYNLQLKRKILEKININIETITKLEKQYSQAIKNCAYLILTSWPVFLVLILEYIINLRSILVWPKQIVNKELLFELNDFIHLNLTDIKDELIGFLKSSKNIHLQTEMESIIKEINSYSNEEYFVKMYYDYNFLDLKDEIVGVLDSIVNLERKSLEYDFKNNLNMISQYSKSMLD